MSIMGARKWIDRHHSSELVGPAHNVVDPETWDKVRIMVTVYLKFQSFSAFKFERFTTDQLRQALDLFELCGLQKGIYEEIWAYVFAGKKQIGYLIMHKDDFPDYMAMTRRLNSSINLDNS